MSDPIDRLKRYGEDLAESVTPARSRVAAMRAVGAARRQRARRLPRLVFAGLAVVVVANLGTAALADSAVPGDLLYPVDRAYEEVADLVGLGGERNEERLDEATVLADRGELLAAVDHIADHIDDETVSIAAHELQALGEADPELPDHVYTLLESVRGLTVAAEQGDSQTAAEARAALRLLGSQVSETTRPQNPGRDGTSPPDHAATPGPPDHADEQGPPDHADPGPPDAVPGDTAPGQSDPPGQSGNDGPGNADPGPPAEVPSETAPGRSDPPANGSGDQGPPGSGGPPDENPGRGNAGGRP